MATQLQFFRVCPRIFHVHTPTQREVARLFFRFSEFYEGKDVRGVPMRRAELVEHHTHVRPTGEREFTYKWGGFNLPGPMLRRAIVGLEDDLSKHDRILLALGDVARHDTGDDRFCLIGTYGHADPLDHELAHALYTTDDAYRLEVDAALSSIPRADLRRVERMMLHTGYCREVIRDEVHAYAACHMHFAGSERSRGAQQHIADIYDAHTHRLGIADYVRSFREAAHTHSPLNLSREGSATHSPPTLSREGERPSESNGAANGDVANDEPELRATNSRAGR